MWPIGNLLVKDWQKRRHLGCSRYARHGSQELQSATRRPTALEGPSVFKGAKRSKCGWLGSSHRRRGGVKKRVASTALGTCGVCLSGKTATDSKTRLAQPCSNLNSAGTQLFRLWAEANGKTASIPYPVVGRQSRIKLTNSLLGWGSAVIGLSGETPALTLGDRAEAGKVVEMRVRRVKENSRECASNPHPSYPSTPSNTAPIL